MRALRWFLLFVLVAVACGDEAGPVTEIVVYVDADDAVKRRASNIQVRVSGSPGTDDFTLADEGVVDVSPADLPLQFSFAPAGGDVTRLWEVIVGAQESDTEPPFNAKVARGNYIAGESRVLYMVLTNDCSDAESLGCSPLETCEAGACATSVRPAGGLPVYEGGRVPPPDDPVPTVCAMDVDCDDGNFCNGDETCDPTDSTADPTTGCVAGTDPCMPLDCNEDTDECVPPDCPDADDDGFQSNACGGADCDDGDASINPGAWEDTTDGVDNDCDDITDECEPGPESSEGACTDGCDNDGNTFTDCDDFACRRAEACGFCGGMPESERTDAACRDGCDNDGNGFADCEDFACDGLGTCTGAERSCDCLASQSCLTRNGYGFVERCGDPCEVGLDTDPARPGLQPDCPDGQTCWWDGRPGSTTGVCATAMPLPDPPRFPDLGGPCDESSLCDSPYGWGFCILDEVGFLGGYCSVADCAAPGAPMAGVCGPSGACVQYDNESYCLERCDSGLDCRDGYECVDGIARSGSVCVPSCGAECQRGVCDTSSTGREYCRPRSFL